MQRKKDQRKTIAFTAYMAWSSQVQSRRTDQPQIPNNKTYSYFYPLASTSRRV